jgi:maltose O-acetyltransferase
MIEADEIVIGKDTVIGDVDVKCKRFTIGDYSKLGDGARIRGNEIKIGSHFYNSSGLTIGGGGNSGPRANLTIGDRCTLHNNFINVCEPIEIGNDVGLSPEVSLITHGFWQSVFEGHPRKFEGITIDNGVILGYRSTVLPGVTIGRDSVIGACSVVSKDIPPRVIAAGNPCKYIRDIKEPTEEEKHKMFRDMCWFYPEYIDWNYPEITIDNFTVDVLKQMHRGTESRGSDKLRDYLRKYGIRIYTERPFG